MTITLTPELEEFVNQKVARGEYDSPDSFVGEAIQRLIDEEKEEDDHRGEILARIRAAESEIDSGDYVEYSEDTLHQLVKDVHERGVRKLAAERENTSTPG